MQGQAGTKSKGKSLQALSLVTQTGDDLVTALHAFLASGGGAALGTAYPDQFYGSTAGAGAGACVLVALQLAATSWQKVDTASGGKAETAALVALLSTALSNQQFPSETCASEGASAEAEEDSAQDFLRAQVSAILADKRRLLALHVRVCVCVCIDSILTHLPLPVLPISVFPSLTLTPPLFRILIYIRCLPRRSLL